MTGANLQFFICGQCFFMSSNMTRADLSHSAFEISSFSFVNLMGGNFHRSNIGLDVDFDNANMRLATARNIHLENCQFSKTDLSEAIFDYEIIANSTFKQ
ncbi:unnamed protein product [Rotaria magnacalcarata]|uniref:Pentapeptide repeat-containing protein n=1 Tax=Rotaria magnacalcarata TaxID=392030 RepID=A0A816RLP8_9BILA|nr:unnamed protein product [Rotaria magnacalcarata]CAF2139081.1 unnamed protein product [Rotaria magnacalcarata]CAF3863286.1 unnamed protein product [Rotaria magnacalcarata]CAF3908604.1 unnamed protein product [Rotaria magnacalcarata]